MTNKIKFSFLLLLIIICSCNKKITPADIEYVKQESWLYQEGYKLGDGDWVEFDDPEMYAIKNDTIFRHENPKAIIISVDQDNFSFRIRSLSGNETGLYASSSELTK